MQVRPQTGSSFSWRQLILVVLGVSSLSLSLAQTVGASQPKKLRNYCQKQESMFLAVETKSFWVNICGGDLAHTYVGVNKKTGKSVRLPLKDTDQQGTYFEAVKGDYVYILADSTKGKNLTVTRGTRELLREPVLKGW
jgi:hypothetical protein